MNSTAETGLQLLGRLISRPTLHQLDSILFPDGLKSKEVIEISGDTNCGKTLLITKLIIKCILPETWNNVLIDGLDSNVILVNTDQHFQIFKLTELMEIHLNSCKMNTLNNESTECLDSNNKENVIKYSLKNLTILNVYNSFQLQITIHALKQMIADNSRINLVLLDSISSFYWQDVHASFGGNIRKMDIYGNKLLRTLQRCIIEFNVCLIFTRPSYFKSASRQFDNLSSEISLGNINRRINLQTLQLLKNDKMCYQCIVSSPTLKVIKYYTIGMTGFEWISHDKNETLKEGSSAVQ